MNFRNLQAVIEIENTMFKLFGDKTKYPINPMVLTDAEATQLYRVVDSHLSPENLTCDGEAPLAQVRKRTKLLMGAVNELKALGFEVPEDCDLI